MLKQILTISSKNPTFLPVHRYLGTQIHNIKVFLNLYNFNTNWNNNFNFKLIKLLHRKKPEVPFLYYNIIKQIMFKWHKLCDFTPLDKNNGTWTLTCFNIYKQSIIKEFKNTQYYTQIPLATNSLMKKIKHEYDNNIVQKTKSKPKTRWKIGKASILPKNKDIQKYRPLISYYNFISKPWTDKIACSLTVLIDKLSKHWLTMELSKIKQFPKEILKLNSKINFINAFNNKKYTIIKFDIEKQFTNLTKTRVMKALIYVLKSFKQIKNTKHSGFAIKRR